MTANERRQAIIELLCVRKIETRANLAFEFGVSLRTIAYDIGWLSLKYPICTKPGVGGGVSIMDGYSCHEKYLSESQAEFLKELMPTLSVEKKAVAKSILNEFSATTHGGGLIKYIINLQVYYGELSIDYITLIARSIENSH